MVGSIETTKNTGQQTVEEAATVADSLETMTDFVKQINELSNQVASSAPTRTTLGNSRG